jgi:hypothetical protein
MPLFPSRHPARRVTVQAAVMAWRITSLLDMVDLSAV